MTTSGSNFGSTVGAAVEGAESGGDGLAQGEEIAPAVEGAESQGMQIVGQPWYSWRNLSIIGILTVLVFIFIKWLIRMIGSGSGSAGMKGFLFARLKEAASKVRMFLW